MYGDNFWVRLKKAVLVLFGELDPDVDSLSANSREHWELVLRPQLDKSASDTKNVEHHGVIISLTHEHYKFWNAKGATGMTRPEKRKMAVAIQKSLGKDYGQVRWRGKVITVKYDTFKFMQTMIDIHATQDEING